MKTIFFLFFTILSGTIHAQYLSGFVHDSNSKPIPFATLYFKQIDTGTSADNKGEFIYQLNPGTYSLIVSAVGYETQKFTIKMGFEDKSFPITLTSSIVGIETVVVKGKKKNVAKEMVKRVLKNKDKLQSNPEFSYKMYIKSSEESTITTKASIFSNQEDKDTNYISALIEKVSILQLDEGEYKENIEAISKFGQHKLLFMPKTNIKENSLYNRFFIDNTINEMPIVSPISKMGLLTYKYKLLEEKIIEGKKYYTISFKPFKKGNSAYKRGTLLVKEANWSLVESELEFYKFSLKFYNKFRIQQNYFNNSTIPTLQIYEFSLKKGRESFIGNTTLQIEHFYTKDSIEFKKNERIKIDAKAYEKDSIYWVNMRKNALSSKERVAIEHHDSLQFVINSIPYKDSVQAAYNKIELMDILWDGLFFKNHRKKLHWGFGPLPSMIKIPIIGGIRANTFGTLYRQFPDYKAISILGDMSYGIKNKDITYDIESRFFFDPYHFGVFGVSIDKYYYNLYREESILSQFVLGNYYESSAIKCNTKYELFNGFYGNLNLQYHSRKKIDLEHPGSFFLDLGNDSTTVYNFTPHNAFFVSIDLKFTPFQKYFMDKDRKVILEQNFPTFGFTYQKGVKGLGASVDFDFIELSLSARPIIGIFGRSNFEAKVGKYLHQDNLSLIDIKKFRESNPYWFSFPMESFQLLDTTFTTTKPFWEVHYIHHFNGAIVNYLPIVKLLGINTSVGGGFLGTNELTTNYYEGFVGVDRKFKLGKRRLLKLGIYYVVANTKQDFFGTNFKFAIDIIDTWKTDWEY